MSVRQALLALLSEGPKYGYQLRQEFEQRTGATWPLNVGQVYQTLTRLERDALVAVIEENVGHGGADDSQAASDRSHVSYAITDAGRAEVDEWFAAPVPRTAPPRDELAIKLAIAVTLPGVDVGRLVQAQRTATMQAMQAHAKTRREAASSTEADAESLARGLVLDSLFFDAEAELRWLDHCETRLRRAAAHHDIALPGTTTTHHHEVMGD
ncbi:PadR family transcriptional regulator [Nocardioides yefusunii]|uniref:PadR family transcriptional regulator n=1 Tax=Nocardioides yefusunii TaxID=2500546 RepID=A0ABW1R378_9ACTN|nr:PadR family transcriptional regulator [Nocardioides yefusunii]